ncbi:unnamed protein product [Penicillium salamii]|nr:unnamed protein product [Penicillium salamii]CAG8362323.1 unnamed protein product [Penicillium salamii]CAG8370712.1 unnamed protein product [Penicillium salamii]
MALADFGASVLRIDKPSRFDKEVESHPTPDLLTRHKGAIAVDLKAPSGISLMKALIKGADILIDPFRPGVLEKLGLDPHSVLLKLNPRLIVARMTGFRRDGPYSRMAGHDINYLAVSGVLSMLGRANEAPYPPANLLGDFGGGGLMLVTGILQALYHRERSGDGQVVEANMVDGAAYLATMPRLGVKTPMWQHPRGHNTLDGGCPYYESYQTKDGKYMAVGALEPKFFNQLLKGMDLEDKDLPGPREIRDHWPKLREIFETRFKSKTRSEWESVFYGTDACCTPVLSQEELEGSGFVQRPAIFLSGSPARAIAVGDPKSEKDGHGEGVLGAGWTGQVISPGSEGEELLRRWAGPQLGKRLCQVDGAFQLSSLEKL